MEDMYALRENGLFLRKEAIAAGHTDRGLQRLCKGGELLRLRYGTYIPMATWKALTPREQHMRKAEAVILTHGQRVVLCNQTAAAIHDIAMYDVNMSTVHAHLLGTGSGRTESGITYHQAPPPDAEIIEWKGGLVCAPARAALEVAATRDLEGAVVVLDAVLLRDDVSKEDLWPIFESMRYRAGHLTLQAAVRLARYGAASLAESRARVLFVLERIPKPELQVKVYDANGELLGILDFLWRSHNLAGEFDGAGKYFDYLRPGETPRHVLMREKLREQRIREVTGYDFFRMTWEDLSQRKATSARLRAHLERAERMQARRL